MQTQRIFDLERENANLNRIIFRLSKIKYNDRSRKKISKCNKAASNIKAV